MNCGLFVSTQNFTLFFNDIQHSQSCADIFTRIRAELLCEFFTKLLYKQIVHMSCSEISVTLVNDNAHLSLEERGNCDSDFTMTKVDESDVSWVSVWQISLSEEAIVKCDCCAIIDES